MLALTLASINGWIWSTVFHCRDNAVTEKLDYFSAMLIIVVGLHYALIRCLKLNVSIILSLFYVGHVLYLSSLKRFDYSYNILAGISLGVLHNLVWLIWSVKNSRLMLLMIIYLSMSMSLELFDFVPILHTIDAHSLWHLATALSTPYLWKFFK